MSNIKKSFVAINDILLANSDATVASIYDELVPLMSAKSKASASAPREDVHILDDNGNITHKRCGYFKEFVAVEEFGAKASTADKLNTMCRLGVSLWTARNNSAKAQNLAILEDVKTGKLAAGDIEARQTEITEFKTVVPNVYAIELEIVADAEAKAAETEEVAEAA